MPTVKIRYAGYRGGALVSLADYVKREVQGPSWHDGGELESIRSELQSTREFLERLIIVMSETMTPEQITCVLGLENARANGTHVVVEEE